MRLWHWKLIPVLPRQQLLGQWRECCLIAKNIEEQGTPNHILVDPIIEYPDFEFYLYAKRIAKEMKKRGYHINEESFVKHIYYGHEKWKVLNDSYDDPLFEAWHTNEYLKQCYYNLEEKHDRGGISDEEWKKIEEAYNENL
jgi:uncharacterized protein (TIGR02328 family)